MRYIFIVFFLSLLIGCATSTAGISTSNIPIVTKKYKVVGQISEVESWLSIDFGVFGFPLTKPPVSELVDKVIKEKEADALINIRYWNDKTIIFFVTINRFGLNAEAIQFEEETAIDSKPRKK
jgi:hypothetical protein